MRLRLKAATDLSRFPASAQKIFQAMKTYGLIFADNGSDLYVRSVNGRGSAWFRGVADRNEGHISSGGVDRDVHAALGARVVTQVSTGLNMPASAPAAADVEALDLYDSNV